MESIKDRYVFVGIGLTKQGHVPELSADQLAVQAGLRAIEDAGIKKKGWWAKTVDTGTMSMLKYSHETIQQNKMPPVQ
jgi:hypothetical protein